MLRAVAQIRYKPVLLSWEMKEPFVSDDESVALPRVLGRGHWRDEDKDGKHLIAVYAANQYYSTSFYVL